MAKTQKLKFNKKGNNMGGIFSFFCNNWCSFRVHLFLSSSLTQCLHCPKQFLLFRRLCSEWTNRKPLLYIALCGWKPNVFMSLLLHVDVFVSAAAAVAKMEEKEDALSLSLTFRPNISTQMVLLGKYHFDVFDSKISIKILIHLKAILIVEENLELQLRNIWTILYIGSIYSKPLQP